MSKNALSLHRKLKGKIFVGSKISPLKSRDIELIYTPDSTLFLAVKVD